MLIQIASDIHLEFTGMGCDLDSSAMEQRDLLICAGDVAERDRGHDWLNLQSKYSPVVFVAGNHEYYGTSIDWVDTYYGHASHGLHTLQCGVYEQDGVRIAGCTLWTDMKDLDQYQRRRVEVSMTDFSGAIRLEDGSRFTADMAAAINCDHRNWLLQQKDIDIVVTHHAPTWQSVTPYWLEHGPLLNPGFAGASDDIIDALKPKFWIHGHMHSFLRYWHDGKVDGTQIICNARGYGGSYQERTGFLDNLMITVDKRK